MTLINGTSGGGWSIPALTLLTLALTAMVMAAAGCRSTASVDHDVVSMLRASVSRGTIPCLAIMSRRDGRTEFSFGSGTLLDDQLLVTCSHVWPEDALLVAANGDIIGAWEMLARGGGSAVENDWLALRLETPIKARRPFHIDGGYRPAPGDTILVCGYRAAERTVRFPDTELPPLSTIAGVVTAPPPEYPGRESEVIFSSQQEDFHGLSGGPALAWDRFRKRVVLFGIMSTTVDVVADGTRTRRFHSIRRLTFVSSAWRQQAETHPNNAETSGGMATGERRANTSQSDGYFRKSGR